MNAECILGRGGNLERALETEWAHDSRFTKDHFSYNAVLACDQVSTTSVGVDGFTVMAANTLQVGRNTADDSEKIHSFHAVSAANVVLRDVRVHVVSVSIVTPEVVVDEIDEADGTHSTVTAVGSY